MNVLNINFGSDEGGGVKHKYNLVISMLLKKFIYKPHKTSLKPEAILLNYLCGLALP